MNSTCGAKSQTIDKIIDALRGVEGRRVVVPSIFRNQTFDGELYKQGTNLMNAAFQNVDSLMDVATLATTTAS